MRTKMIKARDVAIGQEYWHSSLDTRFTRVGVTESMYEGGTIKEVVCLAKGSFYLFYTHPDSMVTVEVFSRFIRDIPTGEKFIYSGHEYVKMSIKGHDIDGLCGNIAAMCVSDNTLSTFSRESVEE